MRKGKMLSRALSLLLTAAMLLSLPASTMMTAAAGSNGSGSLVFTKDGSVIVGDSLSITIPSGTQTDITPEAQGIGVESDYSNSSYTTSVKLDSSSESLLLPSGSSETVSYTASVTNDSTGESVESKNLSVTYLSEESNDSVEIVTDDSSSSFSSSNSDSKQNAASAASDEVITSDSQGVINETAGTQSSQKTKKEESSTEGISESAAEEATTATKKLAKSMMRAAATSSSDASASVKAEGVYIREFSTQCFYGGDLDTNGTYVWHVPLNGDTYQKGHAFSFRINCAIAGNFETPVGCVKMIVPKSILKNREGKSDDTYEMSIPSKADVEAAANGGESIDSDIDFAYYEDGDNLIIYNIRELPSGYNGYVEMSYRTAESSFAYPDMAKMEPFTATMTVNSTSTTDTTKTADPLYVAIDTTAQVNYTAKLYPYKYTSWQSSWGAAPEDAGKYWYLEWEIQSGIAANQPYNFTITDTPGKAAMTTTAATTEIAHDLVAVKFSGMSWQRVKTGDSASLKDQTMRGRRYDYVVTRIPIDSAANAYTARNDETVTVTPKDLVDAATNKKASNYWKWERPYFVAPSGNVMVYKRADGAYRRLPYHSIDWDAAHYAPSMSMKAGEYSRYDLEDYMDGLKKDSSTLYDGLDYASWAVGYTYPWTIDSEGFAKNQYTNNPEAAYGKKKVTTELIDEGVYATLNYKPTNAALTHYDDKVDENSKHLTEDDFKIKALDFSWYMMDAAYDTDICRYNGTTAKYDAGDNSEVVTFYAKDKVEADTWTQIGTYTITGATTGTANFNSQYVKSTDGNRIVFADNYNCVAYRLVTSNTRYYTELFTVPDIALKENSATMKDLLGVATTAEKNSVVIANNNTGKWYVGTPDAPGSEIATIEAYDIDYLRTAEHDSWVTKSVSSATNHPKQRYYTITWQIKMGETVTSGEEGDKEFVPQSSGTFYDLLPEGAAFVKKSVQVMDAYDNRELPAFTVNTIDNYQGSGRTMVIVHVNETGKAYVISFDTNHAWNAIKDYGNMVYNPVAYETGNSSIYNGFPDNGGKIKSDGTTNPNPPIRSTDIEKMSSLDDDASNDTGEVKKFIYAGTDFDINAITAASSGLTKKVKSESDTKYTYEATTTINGLYSYEIRYQNAYTTDAKNLIFFDSLENYYKTGTQEAAEVGESDWKGILQSIEVNQLKEAGAAPVVYAYTGSDDLALDSLGIDKDYDFTKATGADNKQLWSKIDADDLKDLEAWQKTNGTIKAFAIDARKTENGSAFVLGKGKSVTSHVYMKAPDYAPDAKNGNQYPYTYNNIYLNDTVIGDTGSEQDFFIHQDYTKVKLVVSRDLTFKKVNKTNPSETVSGVTYRIAGTSDYGTQVDMRVTTNSNGIGVFEGIEKGSYLLQEYETTDDWLIDTTEHTVKVDGKGILTVDGEDYTNTNGSSDKVYVFQDNPRIHGDLSFSKRSLPNDVERNGIAITGAKFRLSGTSDYGNNVTLYATSDNGTVVFKNIEKGIYELQEVSLPDGSPFVLSDRVYQVVCDESGNVAIVGEKADGKVISPYTGTWSSDKEGTYTEWVKGTNGGTQMVFNEDRYFSFDLRKVDATNTTTALKDAEYTISGTSDLGTVYNDTFKTDENGLIEFALNHHPYLEKGTYILQETKAPKVDKTENGVTTHLTYALDPSRYLVMIDYHGNVSIVNYDQGNAEVTRDNNGNFVFKDDRVNSGEITITKIWDDDADNSTRPLPKITITTYDPSEPKILLKFNPTGGTWSSDNTTAAKQATFVIKTDSDGNPYLATYTEGAKKIAQMVANAGKSSTPNLTKSGAKFNAWSGTDSDGKTYTYKIEHTENTEDYKIYKLKDGNKVSIDPTDSITITAQWDEPKVYYAVSPYGIGKETLKDGTAGITFGPATGNMFSNRTNGSSVTKKYVPMVNAHKVSDSTYLLNDSSVSDGTATTVASYDYIDYNGTKQTMAAGTIATGQTTVTPAQVKADMDAVQPEEEAAITDNSRNVIVGADEGTDSAGHAYRCIHYDNWNTILYWNKTDPHVYDKCVENHCSKRLVLRGNNQNITWNTHTTAPTGDGDSYIGISKWDNGYDNTYGNEDEYSASLIRAKLVGADKYTSEDPKSAGEGARAKYTEANSAYMAFPEAMRNQIGAKALYDTKTASQHGNNVSGSRGPYYDKLWLFDYNEIFKNSNNAGSSVYTERNAFNYGARGSLGWWWLRSRNDNDWAWGVNGGGDGVSNDVGYANRVAPGFVLKR